MDLALNNLQRLICHKTNQTKPNHKLYPLILRIASFMKHRCQKSLEYADCTPSREVRPYPKKEYITYDSKLHLMVRLQFKRSEESGVTLLCHYTQVHSNKVWYYLWEFDKWVKQICFEIICIWSRIMYRKISSKIQKDPDDYQVKIRPNSSQTKRTIEN